MKESNDTILNATPSTLNEVFALKSFDKLLKEFVSKVNSTIVANTKSTPLKNLFPDYFTKEKMMSEYILILNKESSLPRGERDIIYKVTTSLLIAALFEFKEEQETKEDEYNSKEH